MLKKTIHTFAVDFAVSEESWLCLMSHFRVTELKLCKKNGIMSQNANIFFFFLLFICTLCISNIDIWEKSKFNKSIMKGWSLTAKIFLMENTGVQIVPTVRTIILLVTVQAKKIGLFKIMTRTYFTIKPPMERLKSPNKLSTSQQYCTLICSQQSHD